MGSIDDPDTALVERIAELLRDPVCREGLVAHRIAQRLAHLAPSAALTWLRVASGADEPEELSRALVHLVRNSLASLDPGPARHATELLLGVGRTRGMLRKDRRLAAAQALDISREYFRKRREYRLLLDLAGEMIALEARRPHKSITPSPESRSEELLALDPLEPGDDSEFVADVTIPDGTTVGVGREFTKTWEIRNTGVVVWERRYLRREGPTDVRGLCRSESQVPIPATRPGDRVRISVVLVAPGLPGTCRTDWKMVDSKGRYCFPNKYGLYCIVNVVD